VLQHIAVLCPDRNISCRRHERVDKKDAAAGALVRVLVVNPVAATLQIGPRGRLEPDGALAVTNVLPRRRLRSHQRQHVAEAVYLQRKITKDATRVVLDLDRGDAAILVPIDHRKHLGCNGYAGCKTQLDDHAVA
jgi:hypothetical protein